MVAGGGGVLVALFLVVIGLACLYKRQKLAWRRSCTPVHYDTQRSACARMCACVRMCVCVCVRVCVCECVLLSIKLCVHALATYSRCCIVMVFDHESAIEQKHTLSCQQIFIFHRFWTCLFFSLLFEIKQRAPMASLSGWWQVVVVFL